MVFQDFLKLQLSIKDNIFLEQSSLFEEKQIEEQVYFIGNLKNGINTVLGQLEEGGIELSGGEWQLIAILRAMVKTNKKIIVMDEPTSYLDSKKEDWFYTTLLEIPKDMTVIIVSHSVCELIRKQSQIPIIMLTALDSESDQVKGLDLQADDYITKPFSMPILLRKIAAVLRRSNRNSDDNVSIHYKDLILDLDGYKVYIKNVEYDLTQREFEVLRELLYHQGKVLSRQYILNTLWKYDFYGDERVVDTHIKNLRKKLNIDYIETIRGVGYKIEKEM